jgi:hypothetical protein
MRILPWQLGAALLVFGASIASAQTPVYGTDGYGLRSYKSTADANFVTNWSSLGAQPTFFPANDFDETATDWYVAQYYTYNYGKIDQTTGLYTNVGTISPMVGSAIGWSCDVNGTWWYGTYDSTTGQTVLYTVDINTGASTLIGNISPTIQIDIAIDTGGNLYGHSINDDALYSINTSTGAGTYIGPTGLLANYAQGMDFDWATNTLYATHFNYTGVVVTNFCSVNTATGAFTVVVNTDPLNAEMEMACKAGVPGEPGEALGFGDTGCPCGNNNDGTLPLGGCAHDEAYNGNGAAGARLDASGQASVSNDSVVLMGSRGQVSNSTLFFQGNNDLSGTGVFLGDGLRIAGGGVIRIQAKATNSNGDASTSIGISAKTGVSAGETKYYQWWIRDPAGSSCGAESNTSNGYMVTWTA